MRRVFQNNAEVCHKWASQSQEVGRAGNISFDGRVIYSYGHWPMASFDADDPGVVLFRDGSYSSSTGQHQSLVSQAISHCKVFTVVSGCNGGRIDHAVNIQNYSDNMRIAADKFWNSSGYHGQYSAESYGRIVTEARQYAVH